MENHFRIKKSNLPYLKDVVLRTTHPKQTLHGGCGDGNHCPAYDDVVSNADEMVGVVVAMSGTAFHKLLVERGLVAK